MYTTNKNTSTGRISFHDPPQKKTPSQLQLEVETQSALLLMPPKLKSTSNVESGGAGSRVTTRASNANKRPGNEAKRHYKFNSVGIRMLLKPRKKKRKKPKKQRKKRAKRKLLKGKLLNGN